MVTKRSIALSSSACELTLASYNAAYSNQLGGAFTLVGQVVAKLQIHSGRCFNASHIASYSVCMHVAYCTFAHGS